MRLLIKLANIADQLDASGNNRLANRIDALIKTAKALNDELVAKRFWSKVNKSDDGCWEWQGARDSSGYGICTIGGKNHNTHRLAWEWANKRKIPKGLVLLHTCDNRKCCNSGHLQLGTGAENVADRVKKDRSAKGKSNGRARLKERDVRKIRKLRAKGWTEKELADLYDVGRSTISHICRKTTWNWLND